MWLSLPSSPVAHTAQRREKLLTGETPPTPAGAPGVPREGPAGGVLGGITRWFVPRPSGDPWLPEGGREGEVPGRLGGFPNETKVLSSLP